MKYCSECGAEVRRRWIANDHRWRYVCAGCNTTHYENPRIIVGCFAHWRDTVLMCRRAEDPGFGKWSLPMGFLECGETLEAGAAREVFEETGARVDPESLHLYSVINLPAIEQIAIAFRAEFTEPPTLIPGAECLEVAFRAQDEVAPEEIAWGDSMGDGPGRVFRELRLRQFTIHLATIGTDVGQGFKLREYRIL